MDYFRHTSAHLRHDSVYDRGKKEGKTHSVQKMTLRKLTFGLDSKAFPFTNWLYNGFPIVKCEPIP